MRVCPTWHPTQLTAPGHEGNPQEASHIGALLQSVSPFVTAAASRRNSKSEMILKAKTAASGCLSRGLYRRSLKGKTD